VKRLAIALAAGLLTGAGAVMLAAIPASADSSPSSTSQGSAASTAPTTTLGGYTLSSAGSGLSIYYEQPNFPIPATPTLEWDVGYSSTTFNSGPHGNSLASVLWPGAVIAGGGSQLSLLLGPYLQQYCPPCTVVPVPNPGNWPIQANADYPQGPDTASNDNGPSKMDADSSASGSTATSSMSTVGGNGTGSLSAALVTVGSVASTAQSTISSTGDALAEATSEVSDVAIAGGLVHVGQVTSTATSSSDGNQATLQGASAATGVTVAGEAVTVSSSGVSPPGQSGQNPLSPLAPSVSQVLQTAGITMTLTNPADTVNGPSGQRQLDGLQVKINLATFDKNLATLLTMLPSQLRSEIYKLPIPVPNQQTVTLDFGWVNVQAAASPSYNAGGSSSSTDNSGTGSSVGTFGDSSQPSSFGPGGTSLPGSSGGTSLGSSAGTPGSVLTPASVTAPAKLFKGIGSGLIVLGLLLAAALAGALWRADKLVGALTSAAPCMGEHPENPLGGS